MISRQFKHLSGKGLYLAISAVLGGILFSGTCIPDMQVLAADETMTGTIGGLKVSAGAERTINVGGDGTLISTGSISMADAANVVINGNLKTSSSIQMSREGTGTGAKTLFTLNGDLAMKSENKDNPYIGNGNQFYPGTGRWASAGIDISMTSGSIMNFNGNVDVAVKGTAIETDPFYKDYSGDNYNWSTGKVGPITDPFQLAVINMNEGNVSIDTPESTDTGYLALANYGGTINVNMAGGKAGTHDVTIKGNILDMKSPGGNGGDPYFFQDGQINIGLNTDKSSWTGVVDNTGTDQAGNVNLYLANGAVWNHEARSKVNALNHAQMPEPSKSRYGDYDGITHVYSFTGASDKGSTGYIYQNNKANIEINKYSGYSTVFYSHDNDGTKYADYSAGDIIIKTADAESAINLVTNRSSSINGNDDKETAEVLNALAQKLVYSDYTANPNNLKGYVTLAEGLTASSKSIKFGLIDFDLNGRGSYGNYYGTDQITGDASVDTNYVKNKILKDGVYTFNKNATINFNGIVSDTSGAVIDAKKNLTIDANGYTLGIHGDHKSGSYTDGIRMADNGADNAVINAKTIEITAAGQNGRVSGIQLSRTKADEEKASLTMNGDVNITSVKDKSDTAYKASGVDAEGNSEIAIHGSLTVKGRNNTSAISGTMTKDMGYSDSVGILAEQGSGPKGGTVSVDKDVDILVQGTGIAAKGGGSVVTVKGGGSIETIKGTGVAGYAIAAESGTASVNTDSGKAGSSSLAVKGNIGVLDEGGTVNLGLSGAASFWQGTAVNKEGTINLYMDGGASWTNEAWDTVADNVATGHITNLASTDSNAGTSNNVIHQNGGDITVDHYSGNTTVIYKHTYDDAKDTTIQVQGGDFRIKSADAGSTITLVTDSTGITSGFKDTDRAWEKNRVSEALNTLAHKLYYMAGDGHLKGKVIMASGLTASSAVLKSGDISFSTDKDGTKVSGQGYYGYDKAQETISDSYLEQSITGSAETDTDYVKYGVLIDDGKTYTFTKDSMVSTSTAPSITVGSYSAGGNHDISITDLDHNLTFDYTRQSGWDNYVVNYQAAHTLDIKAKNLAFNGINRTGRVDTLYVFGANKENATIVNATADTITLSAKSSTSLGDAVSAFGNAIVNLNGNVNIIVPDGETSSGQFNSAGLIAGASWNGKSGVINVNGNINYSNNAAALVAQGDDTQINVNGGGVLENTSGNTVISAQNGSISVNMNKDRNGSLKNKITIKGNIIAMPYYSTGKDTIVNIGLGTKDSTFTGSIYNAFPVGGIVIHDDFWGDSTTNGAVNLYMESGSIWNNKNLGENIQSSKSTGTLGYDGSHLTKLTSKGGIINQNDTKDITIDNYDGNVTVVYQHDENMPSDILGGALRISSAADNSKITLMTDSKGLSSGFSIVDKAVDQDTVNNVLDKLANKLYYTANDGKLAGTVEIAEGLTVSSKVLKAGTISFSTDETGTKIPGQGYFEHEPAVDPPTEQNKTDFNNTITGDVDKDIAYVMGGVLIDHGQHYVFTKDSTITAANTINVGAVDHAVDINAKGHTLTLDSETTNGGPALSSESQNGVTLTADKLKIIASNKSRMEAIHVSGTNGDPTKLTINGNVDMQVNGQGYTLGLYAAGNSDITFNGNINAMGDENHTWGLSSVAGAFGYYGSSLVYSGSNYSIQQGPRVTVNGNVNAKVDGNLLFANGGHAKLTVNGGGNVEINKESTHHYYAMIAECGTTSMNVNLDDDYNATSARTNKLVLKGNISASTGAVNSREPETKSIVNLGLATGDSEWTGVAQNKFPDEGKKAGTKVFTGAINLFLQNGATWNNEEWGTPSGTFTGSHLAKLVGGDSLASAGIINQNDSRNIRVDNYSGNTMVVYKHDIADDTTRDHADLYGDKAASIIGGDFKITDAAAGSTITLVTDSTGVSTTSTAYTDKNLVNDLLDKLANKLYYSGYANGNLKGYVRIAEGLTSSSITAKLRQEDISFYNADEAKTAGMTEGQGHYSYSLAYPDEQVKDPMATVIDGSSESKDTYRDAGIYKDNIDSYDFTKKPATVNSDGKSDSIIHAGDNDVNVKTNDVLNINAKDGGIGMKAENGKTVTTTGNTSITAKDGTGILADKGTVKLANDTAINGTTGMEAKNGGTITADGKTDITATGNALHADGDGSTIALKNGTISGALLAENKGTITTSGAALKGDVKATSDGTVALTNGSTSDGITADGGTITTNGTDVTGDALAKENGTVTMTNGKAASVTADGGTASTDGTEVDGLISAKSGGSASMKNGSAKGLSADKDSTVTAVLDKADAKLDGNVANEGNATVNLSNGASWTGDSTGTGTTTANIGSGSTWTGTSSNGNTSVALEGTWKQTGDSTVDTLTGKGGTLDKSADGAGETKIASYSGDMSILYSHDASSPTEINGAVTTVGQAVDGSSISLITDSRGLSMDSKKASDKNTVSETFNQLAHKLHYTANDGKLNGKLKIAEGLTSSSVAIRAEDITFDKDGIGTFTYDPAKDHDIAIEYGSEETRMMKGTKSALLGSAMMWRSNNNDIQRRMGDLRLGQGETGVWARYMGGKNKYDQQNTYLNQDYDIGQAGFDKKVGDWTVGLAIDHGDGKSHYIGGRGKEKMNTLALYGTRVSNDGKYFDVIVKTGQVKNKFDVSNEIGNKLHGDYKAWGNSISLEYGKRFVRDSGFYLDPSVEFTAGRLNGKNFTGTSDLGTLYVHQHGFNSAIGRIGFSIGRQLPKSNLYAKLALAHEFAGDFKTDFYADDGGLKSTKVDLSDTWLDMELGGSLSLGKNVYLYGTYTRTFEADMATKWRADVGVRYTF